MKESDLLSINELMLIDKAIKSYQEACLRIIDKDELRNVLLKILDLNDYLNSQLKINTIKKED